MSRYTLADFMAVLFEPEDLIELRPVRHDGKPQRDRDWLTRDKLASMNGTLTGLNADQSVYFGANPRNHRGGRAEHVATFRCLFADFDDGATWTNVAKRIDDVGFPHPSAVVNSGGGVHTYWRLTYPTDAASWTAAQRGLIELLGSDPTIKDAPRIMRLPTTINRKPKRRGAACTIIEVNDGRHDLGEIVALLKMPEPESRPASAKLAHPINSVDDGAAERRCMVYLAKLPEAVSGEDGHSATFRAAAECFRFGLGRPAAERCMDWFNANRCFPAWAPHELAHKLDDAEKKVQADGEVGVKLATEAAPLHRLPAMVEPIKVEVDSTGNRPLTELGNAERLVDRFGEQIRHNATNGRWMLWDGKRWAEDHTGTVVRFAKQAVRLVYAEAATAENADERDAIVKHAKQSEKAQAIGAILQLARTEPGIPITATDLDADPWLLNCGNGSLSLKGSPKLRPHAATDNCTRLIPANYHADAECPLWLAFLDRVMDGDTETIEYLQRLVGLCLTGDVNTQVFPCLYGSGANGKSVFADLVLWLLADYAGIAPDSLLTVSAHAEHPTEIAGLCGKRLVVATENDEGKRLRVGLVKRMTGDATLTGRFMRQDYFTFPRTHKTWLVTNHKPSVSESKDAIWRRMHLVPFGVTIPEAERDEQLLDKLKAEADGILAWAVGGCSAWQRVGLNPPKAVQDATREYRDESDALADFLSDTCIVNGREDNTVSRNRLRSKYVEWCKSVGECQPLSAGGMYERLLEQPDISEAWPTDNGKRTRGFKGITLHHAPESTYTASEGG